MNRLKDATKGLYKAFSSYPLQPTIAGCPHCDLADAEGSLHARPLRELTWDDFGVYPFKAMTTFGEESDFKHFLPRMLELSALDPDGSNYDLQIVFAKLAYAEWASWHESEVLAVRCYVQAWELALARSAPTSEEDADLLADLRKAASEAGVDPASSG